MRTIPVKELQARLNTQKFLTKNNLGNIRNAIAITPEHKANIVLITHDKYERIPSTKYGKVVHADAVFTQLPDITLSLKVGDCTTTIIYAEDKNEHITGIIHSGKAGVELELPRKSIQYLKDTLKYPLESVKVAFIPHLNKNNRILDNLDWISNNAIWKGWIEPIDDRFMVDEEGLALNQYIQAGIKENNIYYYDIDTFEANKQNQTYSHKYAVEMEKSGTPIEEGRFLVAVRLPNTTPKVAL